MEDTLITLKTFHSAKEKGFSNIKTFYDRVKKSYCDARGEPTNETYFRAELVTEEVIPTQSLLAKWLREVHLIYISVIISDTDDYINEPRYKVEVRMRRGDMLKMFKTTYMFLKYDDALETGLQEALKLIKL